MFRPLVKKAVLAGVTEYSPDCSYVTLPHIGDNLRSLKILLEEAGWECATVESNCGTNSTGWVLQWVQASGK
jgi:hypothetical protein